jgi:hypothetical protein
MKQRIYIDTSVIGGCEDEEFSKWSVQKLGYPLLEIRSPREVIYEKEI